MKYQFSKEKHHSVTLSSDLVLDKLCPKSCSPNPLTCVRQVVSLQLAALGEGLGAGGAIEDPGFLGAGRGPRLVHPHMVLQTDQSVLLTVCHTKHSDPVVCGVILGDRATLFEPLIRLIPERLNTPTITPQKGVTSLSFLCFLCLMLCGVAWGAAEVVLHRMNKHGLYKPLS